MQSVQLVERPPDQKGEPVFPKLCYFLGKILCSEPLVLCVDRTVSMLKPIFVPCFSGWFEWLSFWRKLFRCKIPTNFQLSFLGIICLKTTKSVPYLVTFVLKIGAPKWRSDKKNEFRESIRMLDCTNPFDRSRVHCDSHDCVLFFGS